MSERLEDIAWAMVEPGKGILAADESTGTIQKRFDFAAWMFEEAGFPAPEARARGRMMVAYLMGESTTDLKRRADWRAVIEDEFEVLMRN